MGHGVCYFETAWKPDKWNERFRFVLIRKRTKKQRKGEVQLDLFLPYEYGYEFKVVVTNKTLAAKHAVAFHDGRGSHRAGRLTRPGGKLTLTNSANRQTQTQRLHSLAALEGAN